LKNGHFEGPNKGKPETSSRKKFRKRVNPWGQKISTTGKIKIGSKVSKEELKGCWEGRTLWGSRR